MRSKMRFMIAVFNYGRIESLTDNLGKFEGLDPAVDTLVVYDCSDDPDRQRDVLADYCRRNGLKLGKDLLFKSRVNWGLAEGGRIDLAADLRRSPVSHSYLLQFQEHYLDTASEASVWPKGKRDLDGNDVSGQVKGDCIKSGQTIDLGYYARLLDEGIADVLYSSQQGIGLFPYWKKNFFCIDGVNFASSVETYLDIFDERACALLQGCYDSSYRWALFAEHYVGYRMMQLGLKLCDTYHGVAFRDTVELIAGLGGTLSLNDMLHVSERYYATLFNDYMDKVVGAGA